MTWRVCVIGLCLLVSGRACAVGMDCKTPRDAVQKTVCAHAKLRNLDRRMSALYVRERDAMGVSASRLRRDQVLWRIGFQDQAWSYLSDPGTASDAPQAIDSLYRSRIRFLNGLPAAGKTAGKGSVLGALVAAIRVLPVNEEDLITALRKQSNPLLWPTWRSLDGKAAFMAALPAKRSAQFDGLLTTANAWPAPGEPVKLAWLTHAGFGAAYTVEGSMDCQYWTLFTLHGDALLHPVPMPDVLVDTCWNHSGDIARLGKRVVAISETVGILSESTELEWQAWDGSHWEHPAALRIRYDYRLTEDFASCAARTECARLRGRALRDAVRYDARPLPGTLKGNVRLDRQQRDRYLRMRRLARRAGTVRQLPQLAGQHYASLDAYGSEATYFPVWMDGTLLLGRIGHGHIGWREDANWLVGYWKLEGGQLVPQAGIVVVRRRTRMTLMSSFRPMPPGRRSP